MTSTPSHEHDVPDTQALYAAAHQLLLGNKPRDAAVLFRLMLHIVPEDERAWIGLGTCHEAIEQLEVAAKLYTMGHSASESIRCLIAAARVYNKQGREDEAAHVYGSAIEAAVTLEQVELATLAQFERQQLHVR